MDAQAAPPPDGRDIRASLAKGNAVLFLGAGPSCGLGAPSWRKLREGLAEEFVPAEDRDEASRLDWWTFMDHICDTLGRRAEVEAWTERRLGRATLESWLRDLLSLPWVQVFTTNYDDLPERLNNESAGRDLQFREFFGGRLPSLPGQPGQVPIIKLMGDARARFPSPGAMVLSASDRTSHNSRRQYEVGVKALREHLDAGRDVVAVGSSLDDGVLVHVLNEVSSARSTKADGRLFLCAPSPPSWLAQQALKKFSGLHFPWTAAQVAERFAGIEGPAPTTGTRRVRIGGHGVSVGRQATEQLQGIATLIDTSFEGQVFDSQELFLARSAYSRPAFQQHWDFARQLYNVSSEGKIVAKGRTVAELASALKDPTKPRTSALLVGPPGSAKTMTALRLAHDWANANGLVVFAESRPYAHDAARLAAGLASLQEDIVADPGTAGQIPNPGILVVIDDAGRDTRFLERFWEACRLQRVRDFRLLVIGHPPAMEKYRTAFDTYWDLPAQLEPSEVPSLRSYVARLPSPPSQEVANVILAAGGTFWHVFYQLVSPTQLPLEKTIIRYADGLDGWRRDLVHAVAIAEAVEIPLPTGVLHRMTVGRTRAEILKECTSGPLGQVVFVEGGQLDCVRFLNRWAAEALCTAWATKTEPSGLLSSIVLLAETATEQKFIGDALGQSLGRHPKQLAPNSFLAKFVSLRDREFVVGQFADKFPSPTTLLQHAKLIRRLRHFHDAVDRLEEAMRLADSPRDRENVHHGLAITLSRLAVRTAEEGDIESATTFVDRAQSSLSHLTHDRLSYKYSALAEFLEAKSCTLAGAAARGVLWDAWQHAKTSRLFAKDGESKQIADDLVERMTRRLGSQALTWEEARELAKTQRSASGYIHVVDDLLGAQPWSARPRSDVATALVHLAECVKLVPHDGVAALYAARLAILVDPQDPRIQHLLDTASLAHLDSEVLPLRALVAACRDKRNEMLHFLNLLGDHPEAGIAPEARADFLLRDKTGLKRFTVRAGPTNWIQVVGDREGAAGWNPGDEVHVELTVRGLLLRTAMPPA